MGFIVAGEQKGCVLLQQPFLLVIPMTISVMILEH